MVISKATTKHIWDFISSTAFLIMNMRIPFSIVPLITFRRAEAPPVSAALQQLSSVDGAVWAQAGAHSPPCPCQLWSLSGHGHSCAPMASCWPLHPRGFTAAQPRCAAGGGGCSSEGKEFQYICWDKTSLCLRGFLVNLRVFLVWDEWQVLLKSRGDTKTVGIWGGVISSGFQTPLTAASTEKQSFSKQFKNSGFALWVLENAQLKKQHRREHE